MLRKYDVKIKGSCFDTMLAHYLINPDMRHNMDVLAETYLNYTPVSITELIGKKGKNQRSMRDVPLEQITEYAVEDADITFQLAKHFTPELKSANTDTLFKDIELPLLRVLAHMELEGINQVSRPINALLPNESINGNFTYGREIKKIQASVSASLGWSENNNIINDRTLVSTNITQTYGFTVRSNFQKGLNFDVNYSYSLNNSDNGAFENDATTNNYGAGIDWQLGKSWLLRADYDLLDFSNNLGAENSWDLLEASIRYQKPDSRWQYSLVATNLLNAEANVRNTFGQITTSTSTTFILPRYVYFRMRFDI